MKKEEEEFRQVMRTVMLGYLATRLIDPTDRIEVLMHTRNLWIAVCGTGLIPSHFTYEMFLGDIHKAMKIAEEREQ